ncbi:AAA family ATPase [Lacticaseibacillus paracasei]|nr:AAA family ATPase [Lacticaseibacillus paracasei]MEA0972571.1 AAA family ATPase [Lacticaseibacillus paracasei]
MNIERIVVSNYKIYQSLNFSIQNENNIFVGDNGSGKTTLLESIYLALTGRIDGQNAERLLTPDMFSNDIRAEYINQLKSTGKASLPKIIIEIYFKDEDEYALQKGTENSQNIDCPGIRFECSFDTQYGKEYQNRLEITDDEEAGFQVLDIPIEYYSIKRTYFSGQSVIQRSNPFKVFFVDGTRKSYSSYIGKYIYSTIGSLLSDNESSQIRTVYENIRQNLKQHSILKKFNEDNQENLHLAGKNVALTVRESLPDDWLQEITVSVDDFPFNNIGFGLQKMIELELAVGKSADQPGILLF